LERSSFSFNEFYGRRIRRIFPALLIVLTAVYALGWNLLLADEFKQLGKHIAGGAGFVSNLMFWNESGYFDNAAETKPLLHLWSLGVEEQFYIIWPLLLWAGWKRQLNVLAITIAIAGASFALNIWAASGSAVAAFYSPQTRFWELLIGSVLAAHSISERHILVSLLEKYGIGLKGIKNAQQNYKNSNLLSSALSLVGAALVAAGLFTITKDRTFPGWWAVLPTVGTALIISAGTQAWLNRTILESRALVWIGLISFPLYLWHWPLLSIARITQGETPSVYVRSTIVLLSVVLAWLTYRLIERPIRFGPQSKIKTMGPLLVMIFIGGIGFSGFKRDGLAFRTVVKINSTNSGEDGGDQGKSIAGCGIANEEDRKLFANCKHDLRSVPKYALLGDSKATAIYDGLIRTSTDSGRWLFIGGTIANGDTTVPIVSDNEIYRRFQSLNSIAIESINKNKNIETVVLVAAVRHLFLLKNEQSIDDLPSSKNYEYALEGLDRAVKQLIGSGKQIVIVVDNPTLPDPRDCIIRTTNFKLINEIFPRKTDYSNPRCRLDLNHHLELSKQYRDLLASVATKNPGKVKIFDTTKYMCDVSRGVCLPSKNGRLLYSYADHISDYAAGLIGKDLNAFLAHSTESTEASN